jgi:hypothetical protein
METLVDRTRASREARERTKVILLTLTRQWSVRNGYERLGVGRTRFQDLRRRMIRGAVWAVEERAVGRPRRAVEPEPRETLALRRRIGELEHELLVVRAELDIARSGAAKAVEARLLARGAVR